MGAPDAVPAVATAIPIWQAGSTLIKATLDKIDATVKSELMSLGTKMSTSFEKLGAGLKSDISTATTNLITDSKEATVKMIAQNKESTTNLILQDKAQAKQQEMEALGKKKDKWTQFMEDKGKWMKDVAQKIAQFNKFMMMLMRFMPIIKVFIVIILIFSNLLFFVIMLFAYIGAALLEVMYYILSSEPFISIVWFIFFLIADFCPFLIYCAIFGSLMGFITIVCCLLALVNVITKGKLNVLMLCQNSPAAWYKNPNYHLKNNYERGMMCSKPCRTGYYPDEIGTKCLKLPKEAPSFCPQAQVMRFYSGEGKNDWKYTYKMVKTKGNLRFLSKMPEMREEILLKSFLFKKKFLEGCNNKDDPHSMVRFNSITLNICANLDTLTESRIKKIDPQTLKKLRVSCTDSFCSSTSTYPFCNKPGITDGSDGVELIRKIIMAIVQIILFSLTIRFVMFYSQDPIPSDLSLLNGCSLTPLKYCKHI